MQRVFVLDRNRQPLMPCHPKRARLLLKSQAATVFRRNPFTILLKNREGGQLQKVELKVDPGSKVSGIALIADFKRGKTLIWAGHLEHRGHLIKARMEARRSLRRTRRQRKTRYRQARFNNRTRPAGWLPPSLKSRVDNIVTWVDRLRKRIPVTALAQELVKFDLQKEQNPQISGIEYQQGSLFGYEVREYLLEKWQRTCAYCGKKEIPLEVEHIQPKSRGGSNRISNLTLSCRACNGKKGTQTIQSFLAKQPKRLQQVLQQVKRPLKEATVVNVTRLRLAKQLKATGLPVSFGSGGRTKFNRSRQGDRKDHFIDAACVGNSGQTVTMPENHRPLLIKAMGRGQRQVVRSDRFGFPRGKAGRVKRVHGFQTGDFVRLDQPKGKYHGSWTGRLLGIRATGVLDLKTPKGTASVTYRNYTLIEQGDGYDYQSA